MLAKLPVPAFVAVPADVVDRLSDDAGLLQEVAKDVMQELGEGLYAVRSSALIEDATKNSQAGQFLTRLPVSFADLPAAMLAVVQHAKSEKGTKIGEFSLLIQHYREPDFSGVTFTRSPDGSREMHIEYHKGKGEDLVGGHIVPSEIHITWTSTVMPSELQNSRQGIEGFKKIEHLFGAPQDIEWVLKGGVWFFLQARPITTLSKADYEQSVFLDRVLPTQPFLYEKTEISEIAPRPTPATLSLLERIYAAGGPVARVYRSLGVQWTEQPFLKVIGNELYVDRDAELRTLLPSFSVLHEDFKPKMVRLRGLLTTFRNVGMLKKVDVPARVAAAAAKIDAVLAESIPAQKGLSEALEIFLHYYELVFEVNMLAAAALEQWKATKKPVPAASAKPLSDALMREAYELRGNSLELSDATPFFVPLPHEGSQETVAIALGLRERARFLTVRLTNMLRRSIGDEIHLFCTLEELLSKPDLALAAKRREEYQRATTRSLPARLSDRALPRGAGAFGVSPGVAEGTVCTVEQLSHDAVLYTPLLTPDLTRYFGSICGIIAEQGGVLSHLAIIAREQGIPVVVDPAFSKAMLGKTVRIDGARGTVDLA